MARLTHIDETGAARMVDVGGKAVTERVAVASAVISMLPATLALLEQGGHKKGDVLAVARVAGIQAAKKCSDLIPLCHPLMLNSVTIDFSIDPVGSCVRIEGCCKVSGKTGVEMEALTAVSVAALTIYDMCKAVDRGMEIRSVGLQRKSGGNSGSWQRESDEGD
ncbi:MAG: cyclic pyranopterin monophosphate synthase MoaC [Halioglobus sp.]|nr:cyclic pyranopterin monophosphate synthase MoaC [Halioglobus sp.]MCB1707973.1 cyclic pyranopterin monophosphate synthase MoaC [Halioglobus sp.]MCP5124034.1 cyclic pyranopterin monophosphate synthase MoaC [Pseudomonadales bacterium]MCP5192131.1 cyclic pyranopterin monophosphate synthase MoaC [Pseudomonadales bacterium]